MGTTPSAAAASDADMAGVTWEWEDAGPVWRAYAMPEAKLLEGAYRECKNHTVLTLGGSKYRVHLDTLLQENLGSHFSRKVRRLGPKPARHTAAAVPQLIAFQDDHGWRPFGATHTKQIMQAHANGKASVQITVGRGTYTIDFASMMQTNDRTKFQRPVRFFKSGATAGAGTGAGHRAAAAAAAAAAPAVGAPVDPSGRPGVGHVTKQFVFADEVCDPTKATPGAVMDKAKVAALTGWTSPASLDEVKDQSCAVCICDFDEDDALTEVVKLGACKGHYFHADCIVNAFKYSVKCPICSTPYAVELGDMPKGTMRVVCYPPGQVPLAGHDGQGTLVIKYHFPSGTQRDEHTNPGHGYQGTSRTAYIPDTEEGREVADLLVQAFRNRQSFTIGTSVTTGRSNVVVWNGIHHKTNTRGGSSSFGYPDETYFARVKEELRLIGIVPPSGASATDADGDVDMTADADTAAATTPAGAGGAGAGAGASASRGGL